MKAISQEQIENISDEFGSTFTRLDATNIANCFFESEQPKIIEIIKKHVPWIDRCEFHKKIEIADNYFLWSIELRE